MDILHPSSPSQAFGPLPPFAPKIKVDQQVFRIVQVVNGKLTTPPIGAVQIEKVSSIAALLLSAHGRSCAAVNRQCSIHFIDQKGVHYQDNITALHTGLPLTEHEKKIYCDSLGLNKEHEAVQAFRGKLKASSSQSVSYKALPPFLKTYINHRTHLLQTDYTLQKLENILQGFEQEWAQKNRAAVTAADLWEKMVADWGENKYQLSIEKGPSQAVVDREDLSAPTSTESTPFMTPTLELDANKRDDEQALTPFLSEPSLSPSQLTNSLLTCWEIMASSELEPPKTPSLIRPIESVSPPPGWEKKHLPEFHNSPPSGPEIARPKPIRLVSRTSSKLLLLDISYESLKQRAMLIESPFPKGDREDSLAICRAAAEKIKRKVQVFRDGELAAIKAAIEIRKGIRGFAILSEESRCKLLVETLVKPSLYGLL